MTWMSQLNANEETHKKVLAYLIDRLETSERNMGTFYSRWRNAERRLQAYIDLASTEQALKDANDDGKPPKITSISIPYGFAAIQSIVTFLVQAYIGRKPIFQVGSYQKEYVEPALRMETLIDFNAQTSRLVRELYDFFYNGQVYGCAPIRTEWESKTRPTTITKQVPNLFTGGIEFDRSVEDRLVYEGNKGRAWDPYLFFPDPRVPMDRVNREGEYVWWRSFENRFSLLKMSFDGVFDEAAVRYAVEKLKSLPVNKNENSDRNIMAGGSNFPDNYLDSTTDDAGSMFQLDQGTIDIIPSELGLEGGDRPVRAIFTIAQKGKIIQAEEFAVDHGMHPVVVSEPYSTGRGFGHLSIADYIVPIQDTMSWFVNTRFDNVRRTLNNMFVVNPWLVDTKSLEDQGPGKYIALKKNALGIDPKLAVMPLPVADVTGGHIDNVMVMLRLAEIVVGLGEQLMGRQNTQGRRSATESRTAAESGLSRMSSLTRRISAQALMDLTEQWSSNIQQFLSMEFYLNVVGTEGLTKPIHIPPESVNGNFHFPVHDGTIPMDKVALLDGWQKLLGLVAPDPELRQIVNYPKMVAFTAELGGVKNFETMLRGGVSIDSEENIQAGVQQGNLVPLSGSRNIQAAEQNPSRRLV